MTDTQQLINDFFYDLLGEEPDLEINITDQAVEVDLQIDPQMSGVVIGYRGEVLTAIQFILGLMVQNQLEEWLPVRLNINNYRQQRNQALDNLARNTARRVLETGQALSLPNLSSYERRQIHQVLGEIPGVVSYSEGEGRSRVLIIDLDSASAE